MSRGKEQEEKPSSSASQRAAGVALKLDMVDARRWPGVGWGY